MALNDEGEISSVCDTALWVATLRGREGERADAVFHDPLASVLAGTRGRKIARSMPRSSIVAWALVVRTSAIDSLIDEALALGIDCVLNLGAGLDTRPYRMSLPAQLRWIEIDFPRIVDLKNSALLAHTPACRIERYGLDLTNRAARAELLAHLAAPSKSTLVMSEGVLPYFSNEQAADLARDLFSIPSFDYWLMDFDNAGKRSMPRAWKTRLKAAPFLLQVTDWFAFFGQFAWQPCRVITSAEQSAKINRPYPFGFPLGLIMYALPKSMREKILSLSGAVLLRKRRSTK